MTHIISHALDNDFQRIEASEEAEADWVKVILEKATGAMAGGIGGPGCTPGYYNNEGRPNPGAQQGGFYGGGSIEFFKLLADWRAEGSFAGVEFGR
jgi:cyclohexanone monooxygenase